MYVLSLMQGLLVGFMDGAATIADPYQRALGLGLEK